MSFTLISSDVAYEDEYGHTGGPDYNMGKEYSSRFTWKNEEDGTYRTAETTYYVNARDEETNEEIDWDDYQEILNRVSETEEDDLEDGLGIQFYVSEQLETTHHTDSDDPWSGDNEFIAYGEGSYMFYSSLEDAEQCAKNMAKRESAEFYSPEFF